MRTIVVGTRKSLLAVTQTSQAIKLMEAICLREGIVCEFAVKHIVTKGDLILDVTLSKVGGKGLFVKEIEQALLDGVIDIAVHSMKDMPTDLAEGLTIGAIPEREDPRDCLISRGDVAFSALQPGAKVGTSSLRRASQLKHLRPDLLIEPIRGNIDSRLRKLEAEGFDAIVLAAAGLHRMGWADRISEYLTADDCVPAVGQGALGLECRSADSFVLDLLGRFQHEATARCVRAERSLLRSLQGSCQVPIGAYADLAAPQGFAVAPAASPPQGLALAPAASPPQGLALAPAALSPQGFAVAPAALSPQGSAVAPAASPLQGLALAPAAPSPQGSAVAPAAPSPQGSAVAPAASPPQGSANAPAASPPQGSANAPAAPSPQGSAEITLRGVVASPDGVEMLRATLSGSDPVRLGIDLAELLKSQGAERILREAGG